MQRVTAATFKVTDESSAGRHRGGTGKTCQRCGGAGCLSCSGGVLQKLVGCHVDMEGLTDNCIGVRLRDAFFHVHGQPDLASTALAAVGTRHLKLTRLLMLRQFGRARQNALAALASEVVLRVMFLQDVYVRCVEVAARL